MKGSAQKMTKGGLWPKMNKKVREKKSLFICLLILSPRSVDNLLQTTQDKVSSVQKLCAVSAWELGGAG